MKASVLSALAISSGVYALPQITPNTPIAHALPLEAFETTKFTQLLSLDNILKGVFSKPPSLKDVPKLGQVIDTLFHPDDKEETTSDDTKSDDTTTFKTFSEAATSAAAATCSNPRVRQEWDSYSNSDRQAYVSAIKCLMSKPPGGQFSQAKSRYEDLVALHQTLTPNVHGNSKFLLWHRYYLFTFETLLRRECGFDRNLPWWDESRYSGNFAASSIFSDQWYGGINANGNCITNGQFANLAINVGPGTSNQVHCLARNNDNSKTINTNSQMVDGCNQQKDYANMAACQEGGAHAWGHNGIGAVMQDVYGSPGDPVFFLHHAFVDRNLRIWQNSDPSRVNNIDGTDHSGNALTLATTINVYGILPDVKIGDILNTMSTTLCYKYNY
ncbi:hypothetical protein ACEQ8H_005725 [Pleosporales sp. CAS-2024a]